MDAEKYLLELTSAILANGDCAEYAELCVSYARRLLENHMPVIFDIEHLSLLLGITHDKLKNFIFASDYFYRTAELPKKSGGVRILQIPSMELKYVQRWIVDNILKNIVISKYATGFCDGSSILKNATPHLGKECIINMDIKDFFPSITFKQVFRIFNYYGYTKEVSFALARICTNRGVLPQGSPASPWLSNIVCLKLDKRLSRLAESYEADYTRYADDITFSGSRYIGKLALICSDILKEEGFLPNEKKTRIAFGNNRQEVTGLIVNNESVHVNRKYKRDVWQEIYYCKKYGVASHMQHIHCNNVFFKEHLYGKVYFIYMIEPEIGAKMFAELERINWDY